MNEFQHYDAFCLVGDSYLLLFLIDIAQRKFVAIIKLVTSMIILSCTDRFTVDINNCYNAVHPRTLHAGDKDGRTWANAII